MSRKSKVLSLSLAQILLVMSNLVAGAIFTRVLSTRDYGSYLQTFLAYEFAVPLLSLGLPSALYYFLANNKEQEKRLILENLLLLFGAGAIFSLFLVFGGIDILAKRFNNNDITRTLEWMVWYPLYTFPVLLAPSVWISKGKAKLNAIVNVIAGGITTLLLICTVLYFKNYEAPTLVRIVLPVFYLPVYIYLIFRNASGNWVLPNFQSMWNILRFSIPLGLATVFGSLATQLASLIVSLLTTPESYATYAVGAKEIPLIGVVTGSIAVVIMADMASKIKENNLVDALRLFNKAAVISATFLFPIMCFLMANAEGFIKILYSEKYINSVIPFRIYLLVIPIRIAYYGSAFIAFGKSKQILYRSTFDLLITGVLCYIFVLLYGEKGAALGLILTLFIWTVPFNLFSLSKYFQCSFKEMLPFNDLFKILLVSVICSIICSIVFLFELGTIIKFILSAALFSVSYLILATKFIPEFSNLTKKYRDRIITNLK